MKPDHIQDILLFVGPSQAGKSSSIKLLTGDQSIVCGNFGKGYSTTNKIKVYKEFHQKLGKSYLHMDTIGLGDTSLQFDDKQIFNTIETELLKTSEANKSIRVAAVLVVESFCGDTCKLSQIFLHLTKIFGYLPSKSIIVLATKRNMVADQHYLERKQTHLDQLKTFSIPATNYLQFGTPYQTKSGEKKDNINPKQFRALATLIQKCQPVQLNSIQKKLEMLEKRAKQIQKKETKTQWFSYQEKVQSFQTVTKILKKEVPVEKKSPGKFLLGCAFVVGAILTVATGGFGAVAATTTALKAGLTAGCVGATGGTYGAAGIKLMSQSTKKETKTIEESKQEKVPVVNYVTKYHKYQVKPEYEGCYQKAKSQFESESKTKMISKYQERQEDQGGNLWNKDFRKSKEVINQSYLPSWQYKSKLLPWQIEKPQYESKIRKR